MDGDARFDRARLEMGRRVDPAHAMAVMVDAGLRPLAPFTRSNDPWPSECITCGDRVSPSYNDVNRRVSRGGCSCRGLRISQALMRDENEATAVMMSWGWRPLEPYPGAGSPWQSVCMTCETVYVKRLAHVQMGSGGCRTCAGVDVSDEAARKTMCEVGALAPSPDIPYPGAAVPWPSTCLECGGSVTTATYARVNYRGRYCPHCWEARRGDSLRLSKEEAEQRLQAAAWEPIDPYPGKVDKPWKALCTVCGEVGSPRLHNVRGDNRCCDSCATRGIDLSRPGFLYLVTSQELRSVKIGISTSEARIAQHASKGWVEVARWSTSRTELAWAVEQKVLSWIRRAGIGPSLDADMLPQGGWSETASVDDVSIENLIQAVEAAFSGDVLEPLDVIGPPFPVHPKLRRQQPTST